MLRAHVGKIGEAAHNGGLCHKGYERESRRYGQPSEEIERQGREARRQMDDTHRLWHRFLRASQSHELHHNDNDDDGGMEQINDNLVPLEGARGARPQKCRNLFGEIMSVHGCRLYFL